MRITYIIIIFLLVSIDGTSQGTLRKIDELINKEDSGWPIVEDWISKAKNSVAVLHADSATASQSLYHTQVTTRSPMGAIIYHTGGILVDYGWIRILGSGSSGLKRSLPDWNKGKAFSEFGEQAPYLLVADDAIGGFFILNGGMFGRDLGKIYYFSPSTLEFEPLNITYSDFLNFCFNGDLNAFYKDLRWKNWKQDVENLNGDRVFSFYPYLWSKEGKNIKKSSRTDVPVEEQFNSNIEFRKQLGL